MRRWALSGAALQGLFRNPLADPGLIGVSSGAALGASIMIVLGGGMAIASPLSPYIVPLAAIVGALLVTWFLYLFAARYGQFSIVTIVLVGIATNALAGVGIGVLQYLSDDAGLRTLTFWMMGSFGRATWPTTTPAVFLMLAAAVPILLVARSLDLLQLGEAEGLVHGRRRTAAQAWRGAEFGCGGRGGSGPGGDRGLRRTRRPPSRALGDRRGSSPPACPARRCWAPH